MGAGSDSRHAALFARCRARLAGAAVLLVLAGCGGAGGRAVERRAAPASPDMVRFCPGHGSGWRPLRARAGGGPVEAATVGKGPPVVFLNESDDDPCVWMDLARELAGRGHRAVVFRYTDAGNEPGSVRETLAVARAARGGGRVQLVGASIGGRIVFEAAARRPPWLACIVSLSGELRVARLGSIRAAAQRVRVPVLFLGSRQDPYTDGTRQPRRLQAALRSTRARFRLFGGARHGVLLLGAPNGNAVRRLLEGFLDAHR